MLENLIYPYTRENFFANYFEQNFLHISKTDKDNYSSNFLSEIEEYLRRRNLTYPELRVVKNGIAVEKESYTTKSIYNNRFEFVDVIDNDKIKKMFDDGCSIIFTHLDKAIPFFNSFCKEFEEKENLLVHLNGYMTPPESQSYNLHFDTHDVIIMQIKGEKEWSIYNSPITLPNSHFNFFDYIDKCETKTKTSIKLGAGDILYIPRGFYHQAVTNNQLSFHLTLGIKPVLWSDLFIASVLQNTELRKSILNTKIDLNDILKNLKENSLTLSLKSKLEFRDTEGLNKILN
jgi:hypothetical protein